MSLYSELKRRSVFKVGGAYLVAAWVVIQVADTVAPQLGLPEWAPRFVTLLVLLGFPLALVLAWIFDVTPEGIRADATAGNKRVFAVGTVVALAVLGWYVPRLIRTPGAAGDARAIAVLPFANMSGDPEQEYFSDGIAEEILNVLARTPELRVAARTSSFAFKGQNVEIPDIARALEVGLILEGSVRQQGERVRITAQLIDAASGFHLWSETYNRDLKDIFAVQDEIARAIGDELKVRAVGQRSVPEAQTVPVHPEAYDLYLRGLALWQARTEEGLLDAAALMERAVALDPGFAKAWAGLSLAYAVLPDYTARITYTEGYARARDAAERALGLDPSLPEPYAALGSVASASGRRATALALLERSVAVSPSFASAHQWLGTLLMTMGRLDEGLASLERARALDPQSAIVADNYGFLLLVAGRYDEVVDVCGPVTAALDEAWLCLPSELMARLARSGPADASPLLRSWAARGGPDLERQAESLMAALEGKADKRAIARELAAQPIRAGTDLEAGVLFGSAETPSLLVLLGEPELAVEYIRRATAEPQGTSDWGMLPPGVDPIRCRSEFRAILERYQTVDTRDGKVCGGTAGPP